MRQDFFTTYCVECPHFTPLGSGHVCGVVQDGKLARLSFGLRSKENKGNLGNLMIERWYSYFSNQHLTPSIIRAFNENCPHSSKLQVILKLRSI